MVPRNEKENLEVVDIAEDYYQVVIMMITCDDYTIGRGLKTNRDVDKFCLRSSSRPPLTF